MFKYKKERNEHRKRLINTIQKLSLQGKVLPQIAAELNGLGLKTLYGRTWNASNLSNFRQKYIGAKRRKLSKSVNPIERPQAKPGAIDTDLILNILTSKQINDEKRISILRELLK